MRALLLLLLFPLLASAAVVGNSGATTLSVSPAATPSTSYLDRPNPADPDEFWYWDTASSSVPWGIFAGLNVPTGTATIGVYGAATLQAYAVDGGRTYLHIPTGAGGFPAMQAYNASNSPNFARMTHGARFRARVRWAYTSSMAAAATIYFVNGKLPDTTSPFYDNANGYALLTTLISAAPGVTTGTTQVAIPGAALNTLYEFEVRQWRLLTNPNGYRTETVYVKNSTGAVMAVAWGSGTSAPAKAPVTHMVLNGNDTGVSQGWEGTEFRFATSWPAFDLPVSFNQGFEFATVDQASLEAGDGLPAWTWATTGTRMTTVTNTALRSQCSVNLVTDTGTKVLSYDLTGTGASNVRAQISGGSSTRSFHFAWMFPPMADGTTNQFYFVNDGVDTHPLFRLNVSRSGATYTVQAVGFTSSATITVAPSTRYEVSGQFIRNGTSTLWIDDESVAPVSGSPVTYTANNRDALWAGLGSDSGGAVTTQASGAMLFDNYQYDLQGYPHLRPKE